jgi:CHAT domain-containing protein/tetratricopeptide (TPR) repeat protein
VIPAGRLFRVYRVALSLLRRSKGNRMKNRKRIANVAITLRGILLSTLLVASNLIAVSTVAPRASAQAAGQGARLSAADALRRGRALLKGGKAGEALPLLETALRLYKESNAARGQAAAHDALGDLYMREGQFERALARYRDAYALFGGAAARTEAAASAADALARTDAASKVAKFDDSDFNTNLMLVKIGEAHFRADQVAEAGAAYAQMKVEKPGDSVVSKAKRLGGLLGGPSIGIGRGGGVSIGRGSKADAAAAAAGAAGSAYSIHQNFQHYRQSVLYAAQEIGLGRVAFHGGNLEGATKNFQSALQALRSNLIKVGQIRRFRVAAQTSVADVALEAKRPDEALKLYTAAAKGAEDEKRMNLAWPALRGQGRATLMLAAREQPGPKRQKLQERAVAYYREAVQRIEELRQGSVRADETRTSFLATTKDVFDEASSALAEMALEATPAGQKLEGQSLAHAAEAFGYAEQGRARSLLDLLNETGGEPTKDIPVDLLKRKQDILARQHELAQEISGVSPTGEPPKESVEKIEEQLESLATEYDSIENKIRTANPRYNDLTAAKPLALAEVQRQVLDDRTALAEYSLGRDHSYLFVLTKDSAALFRLPGREQIEKQAAAFRDQIVPKSLRRSIVELAGATRGLGGDDRGLGLGAGASPSNVAAFAAASHALYQTVLAPAAQLIGDKRLLVVADGALNYVPFEALLTKPGGADYSALAYLVKSNEVVYAPSASVVAAVRAHPQQAQAAGGILVVADPVFDSSDTRAAQAPQGAAGATRGLGLSVETAVADVSGAKPEGGFRLARLHGTRAEAQELDRLAKSAGLAPEVWLDLNASESKVRASDLSKYRVVHVATHGLLNAERPQFTGVVLSLVGDAGADGFLRTDEIFNLRLGARLVMLSACETGLGREKRGEGVIGLTRAFMYAGSPTVGVSLWSVADRSTAELMSSFYAGLLKNDGAAPSAALRAAQQQMIDGKKYSAPFHWAPFVLVGDWR